MPEAFELQYWEVDCYQAIASVKTGALHNHVMIMQVEE
jgi:hypothetical protein